MVLAHVSDIHLDLGERAFDRAQRVMRYLAGLPGEIAVLVTGDLADHGLPAEYEQVRKVLTGPHEVLICPGNHDVRGAYREVLLEEPASERPINRVHRVGGVSILMCDSTIPGRDDGLLDRETLDWIDSTLGGGPDGPALLCFHHPPQPLHVPWLDEIRQHGERNLAAILERHPRIAALLCGHAHTPAATTFAGRPLLVAPGVVSTIMLPWEHTDIDYDLPPAVAFHILDDDGRLTTHYRVIP
ncbi:metallophosphoesterase [Actinophytocola sp.]|uniref:metallophosphoesterase n=1 Tax=Actinophytocola sp. TaxID=1872138 RepID=UPI002D7F2800|nr:metallophosphoesterase [Actinophytocola sp.]HET9141591.1 metallophosphoesterase [Actinophytocola sp.]